LGGKKEPPADFSVGGFAFRALPLNYARLKLFPSSARRRPLFPSEDSLFCSSIIWPIPQLSAHFVGCLGGVLGGAAVLSPPPLKRRHDLFLLGPTHAPQIRDVRFASTQLLTEDGGVIQGHGQACAMTPEGLLRVLVALSGKDGQRDRFQSSPWHIPATETADSHNLRHSLGQVYSIPRISAIRSPAG
jgi:hypothetical protein